MTDGEVPHFSRSSTVVARRVAGEMLLVPIAGRAVEERRRSVELYVLNETGEMLWECLEKPQSAGQLARNLMRAYGITAELAQRDVESFLESMRELGAIDQSTSGSAE